MLHWILITVICFIAIVFMVIAIPDARESKRRLSRYWSRRCTGKEWMRSFPDTPKEEIRNHNIWFLILMIFILGPLQARAQQQGPMQMQAQMDAADVLQSGANTNVYKTPLKTYQQWYAKWTANDVKATLDCYTNSARDKELDGANPSEQEFANMSSALQQYSYSNYQLQSFIYTSDSQHPIITIQIAYQKGQQQLIEKIAFTMLDTSTGWKIDLIKEQQK